jgi:hypothetical protein
MTIIGEIQKNKREIIRVSLDDYKNCPICNVRVCYESKPGIWLYSSKGVSFADKLLPDLIKALQEADQQRKKSNGGDTDE